MNDGEPISTNGKVAPHVSYSTDMRYNLIYNDSYSRVYFCRKGHPYLFVILANKDNK